MANKLLSISIPAYNRPEFLEISLKNICKQIIKIDPSDVEILISDDSNKENVIKNKKIIDKYGKKYPISYYINSPNGYESNWLNCLNKTKGKFLLVLGDDDVLVNDAINKILAVIKSNSKNLGLVSFRSYGYDFDYLSEFPFFNQKGVVYYNNHKKFFSRCGPRMTHISTMVLNKELLDDFNLDINHAPSIVQMHFIFYIASVSSKTAFINNYLVAAYRNHNEWGVDVIRLFSYDIGKIMEKYLRDKNLIAFIDKQFIQRFFPIDIIRAKYRVNNQLSLKLQDNIGLLCQRYKQYLRYYFYLLPILHLPFFIAKIYAFFVLLIGKMFSDDKLDLFNHLAQYLQKIKK